MELPQHPWVEAVGPTRQGGVVLPVGGGGDAGGDVLRMTGIEEGQHSGVLREGIVQEMGKGEGGGVDGRREEGQNKEEEEAGEESAKRETVPSHGERGGGAEPGR